MTDISPESDAPAADGAERHGFEAEVAKLLKMMVHSVYSEREVFLRELISNASDACDKRRYAALTDNALAVEGGEFRIDIQVDADAKTLTIADNGIGMSRDDLIKSLGTIAHSGTAHFLENMTGDARKDSQLIGQFGVGFYAVFMVADDVDVLSRKAGETTAHLWQSDGEGSYTIRAAEKAAPGTAITLRMKEDAHEFFERFRLESIVKKYSDHIGVPIHLHIPKDESEAGSETGEASEQDAAAGEDADTPLNAGSALWTRAKSDITDEQYAEFYRHVAGAFDEPEHRLHYAAEGMQSYQVLLYIPSTKPMDLFDPARKNRVKLYVKRVFISDDNAEILPGWLRFLRGVVDSEDLPLNISREMLQNNPVMMRMSQAITKKLVSELGKLAKKDTARFFKIWDNFGAVLKEGIYEDHTHRDALLKLARFHTTFEAPTAAADGSDDGEAAKDGSGSTDSAGEGWASLEDYVSRMKEGQEAIYYITGEDAASVGRSPQLEGFKAKGVEVLLLSDPVDDFWLQVVHEFDGKPLKSITRGTSELKDIKGTDAKDAGSTDDAVPEGELTTLTELMKEVLGEQISGVRASDRLTETAACLVADDSGLDMHLERMLKAHKQLGMATPKVLEINPAHPVIKTMAAKAGAEGALTLLDGPVKLLLDQARILEGETLEDPAAFAKRLADALTKGLG